MRENVLFQYAGLVLFTILGTAIVFLVGDQVFVVAFFTFGAVVAASILIAWAAEASEFVISQGLALAIVAMVQTIPEYFVEGTIAWKAGRDTIACVASQTCWLPNLIANFTGANRLLTGFGWPLILFTLAVQKRRKRDPSRIAIGLPKEQSVEVVFMLGSSLYYIVILLKGTITILDSTVLVMIFGAYLWVLTRLPPEKEEPDQVLTGSPLALVKLRGRGRKYGAIGALFAFSALVFILITDPFVTSLQKIAIVLLGPSSVFFIIQWIAPLLSEFPEKVTAFNWARKITLAPLALLNFLSSAVTELTALVAIIPIVYSISLGSIGTVPVAMRGDEILLTMAQSLYACASLLDLEYNPSNAVVLFGLWLVSTLFVDTRQIVSIVFLVLAVVEVFLQRKKIRVFSAFRETFREHVRG